MTEALFGGSIKADRDERARRAVSVFRSMQPGLTGFAQALTGNKNLQVVVSESGGSTDGKKIYFRPPMALGDRTPHRRPVCDQRDPETLLQMCAACRLREEVLITIYHEIAHNAFGTFKKPTEQAKARAVEAAIGEVGTKFADRVREQWSRVPEEKKGDYINLASLVSPFLPMLVNAIEDARVDEQMFLARKGTRKMFAALTQSIFREGIEMPDGERLAWSTRPLNSQIIIGVFVLACRYDYKGWFHPDIEAALADAELIELAHKADHLGSAHESYGLAFKVLARLRQLGFCLNENEPQDEDAEEPHPEEPEQDQEETDEESDDDGQEDPEGAPEEDQEPDEADPSGGSGDSEAGDDGSPESESDEGADEPTEGSGGGSDGGGDSGSDDDAQDAGGADGGPAGDEPERAGAGDESADGPASGGGEPGEADDAGAPDGGASGSGDADGQPGGGEADGRDSDSEDDDDEPSSEEDGGTGASEGGSGGDGGQDGDGADADGEASDPASEHESSDEPLGELTDGDDGSSDGPDSEPSAAGADGDGVDSDDGDVDPSGEAEGVSESGSPADAGPDVQESGERPDGDSDPEGEADSELPADDRHGEAVDTGGDEGKGGVMLDEHRPSMGSAEEVERDILEFSCHDIKGNPLETAHAAESVEDEAAVAVAVVQGLYFETPSTEIKGVRESVYGQAHHADGSRVDAWSDRWTAYYGDRIGQNVDTLVPESILGPALMEVRQVFADNKRAKFERHLRSGKINKRVLGKRAWAGDDRLFQKKRIPGRKDYAVLLGIDISGSTIGVNIALAKRAAFAQAEMLHRAGIDFAVYAHSGDNDRNGDDWLDIFKIKGFDEPWGPMEQKALSELCPAMYNLDGHTLEYYRKMMEKLPHTDKVILYYSDGQMPAENYTEELTILRREIQKCKSLAITLLGVGIRTNSPKAHGLDTVEVYDDSDLIKVVRHLKNVLLHAR